MQHSVSTGSAVGIDCGRDDRSCNPAAPSRACRASHLYAVRRLMPPASAASVTGHPCCTRSISRARLAGQLRAPLCRFIRGSWLWVGVGVRHQSTSTDGPRVINYPCEQPPETSQLGGGVATDRIVLEGMGGASTARLRLLQLPGGSASIDRIEFVAVDHPTTETVFAGPAGA